MRIDVLYFGRPAERLQTRGECVDVPEELETLSDLLAWLRRRGEVWALELEESRVRCAINQEFCSLSQRIHARDEIAIFSPVSGG